MPRTNLDKALDLGIFHPPAARIPRSTPITPADQLHGLEVGQSSIVCGRLTRYDADTGQLALDFVEQDFAIGPEMLIHIPERKQTPQLGHALHAARGLVMRAAVTVDELDTEARRVAATPGDGPLYESLKLESLLTLGDWNGFARGRVTSWTGAGEDFWLDLGGRTLGTGPRRLLVRHYIHDGFANPADEVPVGRELVVGDVIGIRLENDGYGKYQHEDFSHPWLYGDAQTIPTP